MFSQCLCLALYNKPSDLRLLFPLPAFRVRAFTRLNFEFQIPIGDRLVSNSCDIGLIVRAICAFFNQQTCRWQGCLPPDSDVEDSEESFHLSVCLPFYAYNVWGGVGCVGESEYVFTGAWVGW